MSVTLTTLEGPVQSFTVDGLSLKIGPWATRDKGKKIQKQAQMLAAVGAATGNQGLIAAGLARYMQGRKKVKSGNKQIKTIGNVAKVGAVIAGGILAAPLIAGGAAATAAGAAGAGAASTGAATAAGAAGAGAASTGVVTAVGTAAPASAGLLSTIGSGLSSVGSWFASSTLAQSVAATGMSLLSQTGQAVESASMDMMQSLPQQAMQQLVQDQPDLSAQQQFVQQAQQQITDQVQAQERAFYEQLLPMQQKQETLPEIINQEPAKTNIVSNPLILAVGVAGVGFLLLRKKGKKRK